MTTTAPSPAAVLEELNALGPPGTPFTTAEVAAEFDCTDRTVYNKLDSLVEAGDLETKKVGAKGRVWWRPAEAVDRPEHDSKATVTESTFRQLFENVPGLYLILEPDDYEIVAVSDAYLNATMTEREEIMGETLFEVFPADPADPDPEGVPRLRGSLEQVKAEKETDVMPVTFYPIPRPESERDEFEDRWWSPTNAPVVDESGDINYIIHRVEDVTPVVRQLQADGSEAVLDRLDTPDSHLATDIMLRGQELHEAKEAAYENLQESEERLDAFVTATSEVVYRMNPDWTEMKELDGQGFVADTDEARSNWLDDYIPPDEQERVQDAIEEAIETKSTFELEHQVMKADGTRGWTHSRAVPILNDVGEITEWFGTASDITERKAAGEKLRENEAWLSEILAQLPVATGVIDPDGTFTLLNDKMKTFVGPGQIPSRDPEKEAEWSATDADGEHLPPEQWPGARALRGEDVSDGVEFQLERDETSKWMDVAAVPFREDDDGGGAIITIEDVTQRKQREQLLEAQKELLELIATGAPLEECLSSLCAAVPKLSQGARASILLADDDHESFQRPIAPDLDPSWGEGLEGAPINELLIGTCGEAVFRGDGVSCEDVTTDDRWSKEWRELCVANDVLAGHSEPIRDGNGEPVGSFMFCFDEPRPPNEWEHQLADFATYIAGIAVERQQSRQALKQTNESLERLNDASRELIDADTAEISDRVPDLAQDVLDVDYVGLWRYDDRTGGIYEHSRHTSPEIDPEALELSDEFSDQVWQTFIGDAINVDDGRDRPERAPSESPLGSRAFVPLGRHGVICVGSTRTGEFDERTVDLVETVAATVETTWDRADGEEELERKNTELTRLDELNTLIRDIDQALVQAETIDEIDEAVCNRLAESALFEFVWIGDFDADADAIEPRAWAGVAGTSLNDLTTAEPGLSANVSPFVSAIQTGETQVIDDIATDARAAPWREVALELGARSCLSIPLLYDEHVYGVLKVYDGTPQYDERDTDVLAELGQTIAHAIHTVETRETQRTNSVIELTLRSEAAETPLCRLARETGCTIEFEGLVPGSNGEPAVFFTAKDVASAELLAAGEESLAVEELNYLSDRNEGAMFELQPVDPMLASHVLDQNATVRTLSIDAGTATAVINLPGSADVRGFVEQVRQTVPDLELLGRRTRSRSPEMQRPLHGVFEERLTSRQQEVLQLAYRSGFFESPRIQTGNELADALDISQSTFNYHLRGAQREVFEVLFDHSD